MQQPSKTKPTETGISIAQFPQDFLELCGKAMTNQQDDSKDKFFNPRGAYYGDFTPERLAFNANLQEFANRVAILCALETGGKVSPEEAYKEIKSLWKQLKHSKAELLDQELPSKPDLPPEE